MACFELKHSFDWTASWIDSIVFGQSIFHQAPVSAARAVLHPSRTICIDLMANVEEMLYKYTTMPISASFVFTDVINHFELKTNNYYGLAIWQNVNNQLQMK